MTSTDASPSRWSETARDTIAGGRAISAQHVLLGGIVLVAAVIRLLVLDSQSLWADEALTAYETSLSFHSMLHVVTSVEVTPPLYFVVIWSWAKVFGHDPVVLRTFSMLCGIALVPVAFAAARQLVSTRAGLLAAAFTAVNPVMVWYSQEARAYMLVTLLSGLALLFFARTWRVPSTRVTALWALFASLALMTHFFAGFAIAPQAVALLWRRRSRATWLACAAVAAVQVAMAPFAIADTAAGKGTGWIARVPITHRVATAVIEWGASTLYRRGTLTEGLLLGAGLLIICGLLLWRGGPGPERRGALLIAALAAPILVLPVLLRAVGIDYFLSRNELPGFLAVITVFAAAATLPGVRRAGAVVAAALLVLFALATAEVQTHPYLQRADWRRVALALGPPSASRAVLAAGGTTAQPLKIYLPGAAWSQPRAARVWVSEIDVVGATKLLALRSRASIRGPRTPSLAGTARSGSERHTRSAPLPVLTPPPGTRLIERVHAANWVVSRFALIHPRYESAGALSRTAARWFAHVPRDLLVFFQRPAR